MSELCLKAHGMTRKCTIYIKDIISEQLPTRTIPNRIGIGPDEWFYWIAAVLVGSCPGDCGPGGQ